MSDTTILHEDTAPLSKAQSTAGALSRAPVVIEARGLSKTFRIPEQQVDTLKERVTHPFAKHHYRELRALQDASFDVHQGEFFGIVGRNGSGKSTLLKILAGIYGSDSGRVRMAGRMAPFIELGVGFNPELTARENVALNGVLMGLGRRDARSRLDSVLDFAELREFVDLKIKNYSSGMMVRLAFSIMIQADPDIMLIDEVLAVGDASFSQKCMDIFYERRATGKTVVLVTHDMSVVQSVCHRAMVIHDGEVQYTGEPEQTAMRYYRLNFEGAPAGYGEEDKAPPEKDVALDRNMVLQHARLLDADGASIANIEQRQPIVIDVLFEAARELIDPIFVIHIRNVEGLVVFAFTRTLEARVSEGERVRLDGRIENLLVPGSYSLECWIRRDRAGGDMALQSVRLAQFVVYGTTPRHGLVTLETDIEPLLDRGASA